MVAHGIGEWRDDLPHGAGLALWPVKVLLFGLLAAFLYHLACGLRHLALDADLGFEKQQAHRSALFIWGVVVIATGVFGYLLFCPAGPRP
jgi:succinate dehydrogenase cytochrome b556 subunit